MSRIIYCKQCHKKVGELATGSKIAPFTTYICKGCTDKRGEDSKASSDLFEGFGFK